MAPRQTVVEVFSFLWTDFSPASKYRLKVAKGKGTPQLLSYKM